MDVEDHILVEQWRAGDKAAGQALFGRYFAMIYRFFATKCASDAEDLTQSTFLACLRAREQFRGDSSFKTYLFAIARNELLNFLRTRSRKDDKLDFELSSLVELASSAGTKLARVEEHRQVVEALQRLPVDHQTLLELYYWEELDIAKLCEVFGTTAQNMRARLYRARKNLREQLAAVAPEDALVDDESMDVWMQQQEKAARSRHIRT